MSHLTLVASSTANRHPSTQESSENKPTITPLMSQVMELKFGAQTIGSELSRICSYFSPETPDMQEPFRSLQSVVDALMAVGIWIILPEADGESPPHGLVAYPSWLVKRYPVLKPALIQLEDGLELWPPQP